MCLRYVINNNLSLPVATEGAQGTSKDMYNDKECSLIVDMLMDDDDYESDMKIISDVMNAPSIPPPIPITIPSSWALVPAVSKSKQSWMHSQYMNVNPPVSTSGSSGGTGTINWLGSHAAADMAMASNR